MSVASVLERSGNVRDIREISYSNEYINTFYTEDQAQIYFKNLEEMTHGIDTYAIANQLFSRRLNEIPPMLTLDSRITIENINYNSRSDKSNSDEVWARLKYLSDLSQAFPNKLEGLSYPPHDDVLKTIKLYESYLDDENIDQDAVVRTLVDTLFCAKILDYDLISDEDLDRIWSKVDKNNLVKRLKELGLVDTLTFLARIKIVDPLRFEELYVHFVGLPEYISSLLDQEYPNLQRNHAQSSILFSYVFYAGIIDAPIVKISNGQIKLYQNLEGQRVSPSLPVIRRFDV